MSVCLPCEQFKKGIKKSVNITEAWINVVISTPEVEALAKEREKVCNTCNSRTEIMKVNGISVYKCKECGCPLAALLRSNESCKLNKW
mgnify:CR=1 FL=1